MDHKASPTTPAIQRWLNSLTDDLDKRKRDHLFRGLSEVSGAQGAELVIGSRRYLQFCTNNYLGLAADPEVLDAARDAMNRWGFGSGASRLVAGSMQSHHELEADLAEFKQSEAALVFSSGYAANMAVLTCFTTPRDLIFSDKLNHASLLDAADASGCKHRTYHHKNYSRLAELLKRLPRAESQAALQSTDAASAGSQINPNETISNEISRPWIVTDTVFSMDGDLADLRQLGRLAQAHGALLVTDEAHATGVLGPDGRGLAALQNVESAVAVSVGTLSKALGSVGGFVTGPRPVIETLINRSRQFIYTTALPAVCTAAARCALNISRREPQRRQRVLSLAQHVRTELMAMGYQTGPSESPIIPVMLGSAQHALEAAAALREKGIYIPAIRPPTVAPNTARLRISLMATHSDAQIEVLLRAMKMLRDTNLGPISS
ncbi:MAG: aminotransferase class I/II-fold pyridoxal phosphate-dependent enzyme [Phycisphaerae bacterium]